MVIDLVCGMEVDEKTAKYKTTYQGNMYYFCAPGCKIAYEEDPKNTLPSHLRLRMIIVVVGVVKNISWQ